MDDSEKLLELRVVLDPCDDDDTTLLSFLRQAKYAILNRMYPYITDDEYEGLEVPKRYEDKQIQIAAFLLNKRGAEGETQHIENGIHRNYDTPGIPEAMLRDVFPMVGIPR